MIGRKHKKAPSPQELYRARKQQEEAEKLAYLPPGLINHGNTCFMNSVLQGLIATPLLSDAVRFSVPESRFHIDPQRSPQLTNGHGLGGNQEAEWVEGMPLGDRFITLMEKAWRYQDERTRTSMSPKEILTGLGAKYDQYLDFRQQDAHEFARHLLDAMRMEEYDIIKKRQPPPPKVKRRKTTNGTEVDLSATTKSVPGTPAAGPSTAEPLSINEVMTHASTEPQISKTPLKIPEEERLMTFVDMIFGGQLASILVCETCKKVSYTYEDFNDLSLSIKPEDEKIHRMDRLKNFAKRWRKRAGGSGHSDAEFSVRPRSVPASPVRKSVEDGMLQKTMTPELERRSFDNSAEMSVPTENGVIADKESASEGEIPKTIPESGSDEPNATANDTPSIVVDSQEHISWKDDVKDGKEEKSQDRLDDKGDSWTRLGRRISMGMSKDRHRPTEKPTRKEEKRRSKMDFWLGEPIDLKAPVRSVSASSARSETFATPKPVHPRAKVMTPASSRPQSPAFGHVSGYQSNNSSAPLVRGRSSRVPKPSRDEAAYLRRMLADVPSTSANPLAMFLAPSSTASLDHQNSATIWSKLGGVHSIEDCLRMFTAVEVLDGENKVGCHRCWKIQNGLYREKDTAGHRTCVVCDDDSSEGSGNERETKLPAQTLGLGNAASSSQGHPLPSPAITAATSASPSPSSLDLNEGASIKSVPTTFPSSVQEFDPHKVPLPSSDPSDSSSSLPEVVTTYRGRPIPSISTTAPDSLIPMSESGDSEHQMIDAPETLSDLETPQAPQTARPDKTPLASPSQDSLMPRRPKFARGTSAKTRIGETNEQSSDDSDTDMDSDVSSLSNSVYSESSAVTAPKSPPLPIAASPSPIPQPATPPAPVPPRIPRSKQIILRRSYKRYLVSVPPPVLVIHLKRFQQVGKPTYQFFGNFKKLDDFISFPEYLDMKPYLVPKREDFGLRRHKASHSLGDQLLAKNYDTCMYRLYAVIVHIGNMLGGHYIAYTALPDSGSVQPKAEETTPSTDASSVIPNNLQAPARPETSRMTSFENTVDIKGKLHRPARQWCYISDTVVRLTSLEEVLKAKAYICMYERI